jgi:hypothetical protein
MIAITITESISPQFIIIGGMIILIFLKKNYFGFFGMEINSSTLDLLS